MNAHQFQIRSMNRAAYASGEWGMVIGCMLVRTSVLGQRPCYVVSFPGGRIDWWPVDDKEAAYQFRVTE